MANPFLEAGVGMYRFQTQIAERLYRDLSELVPIQFQLDNSLRENSCMRFDKQEQSVIVKFKRNVDEGVDITHELMHVRMEFKNSFSLLSWHTNDPQVTLEIQEAVQRMRNIVDDTYIFHALYQEFDIFPISQNFFRESRRDIRRGQIGIVQGLSTVNRTLEGAWRLRIAALSIQHFSTRMTLNQRQIATDFLDRFLKVESEIREIVTFIETNITKQFVMNPVDHGIALEALRDRMGFTESLLHLAAWQRVENRWILRRIQ
jgi:hypothetical protein